MVIMQDALPGLKRFLKPVGLNERMLALVIRCVAAFVMHFGRMAAARAATAIRSEPRHRAQMCRFLGRKLLRRLSPAATLRSQLLMMESRLSGTFFFLIDQTLVSQQGGKTENTFSTGNRKRRPRKGRRYNKYKHARKTCHCFVKGLLITPSGIRIPFSRSYYTREYCEAKNRPYRTQTELAAEMIAELPLPEGVKVVVLGDTAFDAKCIREACDKRKYTWVVPLNPERVLAGPQGKRPKVRSLINGLKADEVTKTPVKLADNWVVVGLKNRQDADMNEFAKQRDQLVEQMLQQKRSTVFTDYLAAARRRLETEGRLVIYPEAVAKVDGPGLPVGEER